MRITILVNHDLPALLALNYLMPALDRHQVSVFFSQKIDSIATVKGASNETMKHLGLAELAEFDSQALDQPSKMKSFEHYGAQQLNRVNTLDYDRFADTKPDLVVSIRYMTILKDDVIKLPRLGVINLHSGLLPSYQGVMATFWALLYKERTIGTTLHYIEDSKIDTGSIILASATKANYQRSYYWNVLNIYRAGVDNVLRTITQLSAGEHLLSTPQSGEARYYSFPNAQQISSCDLALFKRDDNASEFL
jgi:methionyl-tRNA formyltransferase